MTGRFNWSSALALTAEPEAENIAREPLAVIDIGSNSVRLVVYDGAVRAPTPVFNEKVLCGLGRSVGTTGRLGEEGVARALTALRRFAAVTRILKVKNIRAIATAAVRDAADGPDFIRRGEELTGTRIEILTGDQEAVYAAEGIAMGFPDASGTAGDLGGGSLELIDIDRGRLGRAASLPLGGLRLIDTTGDKLDRAGDLIDQALAKLPWLQAGKNRPFYAVGGTWRAIARLHMDQAGYPLRVMQGYAIPQKVALQFAESVRKAKKVSAIPGISAVARARREVLPYGALLMERLIRHMEPSEIVFSVFGIREGLLYAQLSPFERSRDPLLCFAEDLARARSRSLDHARELCRWTDALFADSEFAETSEERRLRHAACLMSDIGWRAHPDYRGEQSLNIIAHAGLGGIDHAGRIFLALSVYYRHAGSGETKGDTLPERLRSAISKRTHQRAVILGLAIRTAHMLSIGVAGVIDETPLSLTPQTLILTLPRTYAGLDGERLRRRLNNLAEQLGRRAEVVCLV